MSSITRKALMALTGLFLCLFLVIHVLGNLQLFLPLPGGQLQFNGYAGFLANLPVISVAAYATYFCIVAHAVLAGVLTLKNRRSSGDTYEYSAPETTSPWYTRWMGLLGTILLFFIIIHMSDFWYPFKFGDLTAVDADGNRDLYSLVVVAFSELWRVVLYVLAMIALAFHLYRGLYSGFRSLGLHHPVYSRWVKRFSCVFAIAVATGFAAMPIFMFLFRRSVEQ